MSENQKVSAAMVVHTKAADNRIIACPEASTLAGLPFTPPVAFHSCFSHLSIANPWPHSVSEYTKAVSNSCPTLKLLSAPDLVRITAASTV